LQDDIAKFISDPASPPRLVNILEEGKERREVGKCDDTVTIEDTSDEEDGETTSPLSPLSTIHRLAWRLVSLRR
jgi:hypothetical protein